MKKIFALIFLLFFCSFFLISCKNNQKIEENISEITEIYFYGENNDGDLKCSISVGQREDPYKVDGIHNPTCDFSLISLKSKVYQSEQINVAIFLNNICYELILYFNPVTGVYINDLGFAINENDVVFIKFNDVNFNLYNLSKDFKINYKEALSISIERLQDELSNLFSRGKFLGECYLKILSNPNDDRLFWLFTIQTRNEDSINLIISIDSGEIIMQN